MVNREKECVKQLLSPSLTIDKKSELLVGLVSYWEMVGTKVGLTIQEGRAFCYAQLVKELPESDGDLRQQLDDVLCAIYEHAAMRKQQQTEKKKVLAIKLRSFKKGTALIIRNQNREDLVRLIETKQTRFICEYPDGRRYSIPAGNFVRVSDTTFELLSEEERQLREVIRMLGGSHFNEVSESIVKRGTTMLKLVLDEFVAALDRIENAPIGMSSGVFSSALGPVKKVNPRDEAIAKRIPEVIAKIARKTGIQKVEEEIKEYPNTEVQKLCKPVLDKLKR